MWVFLVNILEKVLPLIAGGLQQLRKVGAECQQRKNGLPTLVVVILPENATDLYVAVKQ